MVTVPPASTPDVPQLELRAARARRHVVRMIAAGGSGHLGGALSCVDILTVLYQEVLRIDPANPDDPARDRFILSAGHKALAQYAVLAEFGFVDTDVLDTYGQVGSAVPGHPDMHKLPGVEASTGALGHGLSIAVGMALAARITATPYRVYTVMGDGELPEGSNWEAFAAAAHHGVDNLVAIIDNNDFQISGPVSEVMSMEPIDDKLRAFGWGVQHVDGHDVSQVRAALGAAEQQRGKPQAIIAKTVKGAGISRLAGRLESHYWTPSPEDLAEAETELDARVSELATAGGSR